MTATYANLSDFQRAVHALAVDRGWWSDAIRNGDTGELEPDCIAAKLALVHSELSEALECLRDGDMAYREGDGGKPEGFGVELADAVIRILDLCGALGIDLETIMLAKARYNESRSFRHGGKRL